MSAEPIKQLTLRIRRTRLDIEEARDNNQPTAKLMEELKELEKARAKAYSAKYMSSEINRKHMNELARQYYADNKAAIAAKNKERYDANKAAGIPRRRKKQTAAAGAYKSPDLPNGAKDLDYASLVS